MLGTIAIDQLVIQAIIGILPHERIDEQTLILSLELDCDFSGLEAEQDISRTIDYAELADWLESWIQAEKFLLLETLAEQVCFSILQRYSLCQTIRFSVEKPAAITKARAARITIERTR